MKPNNDNHNVVELGNKIEKTLKTLSDDFSISSSYLLWSHHARVPAILNLSLKRAYREAGMCDKNHELTEFGHTVFKHLEDQYTETGEPKDHRLPQVASALGME